MKNTVEQIQQLRMMSRDITITKDDLSCFIAGISEVMDGTAEAFYDSNWEGVYEKYGAGKSLEGRARAAQRFFEDSYTVTAGAIHLSQCILNLLWSEWDNITFTQPHTK